MSLVGRVGHRAVPLTRQAVTMTVVFRELVSLEEPRCSSVYRVPITAHQCIPETAPANTTAHPTRFHHELVQELLKTKNKESATVLATAAITVALATKAGI